MTKKKKNIGKIVAVIVVLAIFAIVIYLVVFGKPPATMVSTSKLEQIELVNSISIKGVVESSDSENVYGSQAYTIDKVNVVVGDKVLAGQKLLELDTEELALNIAQRKSLLNKQSSSALDQLQTSERLLKEASGNYSTGQDASIVSAKSRIETSKKALDDAQKNYDDKVIDLSKGDTSQVITAENAIRDSEIALNKQKDDFAKLEVLFANGVISRNDYDNAKKNLDDAELRFKDAKQGLDTTTTSLNREIDQYKLSLETAKINYDEALAGFNATDLTVKQGVERNKDAVSSAQLGINNNSDLIAIQILEKQLKKAVVTAPISGTITAVYAKEGVSANGLLFVIEDTENLKIITKVKEFDYGRISLGTSVSIKSDATGENNYDGVISKIAQTSKKTETGAISTVGDIEFETEVDVITKDTGLRIGMNGRLEVVLERKESVFAVPYDSIKTKDDNSTVVFYLDVGQSETTAKEIPIEMGMETDFYVEITGKDLKSGLKIINDSSSIEDGAIVKDEASSSVVEGEDV